MCFGWKLYIFLKKLTIVGIIVIEESRCPEQQLDAIFMGHRP